MENLEILELGAYWKSFVITDEVEAGTSKANLINTLSKPLLVTNVAVVVKHSANGYVQLDTASRDKMLVQLYDNATSNPVFKSNEIDALILNEMGRSDLFNGFVLPANKQLRYSFEHVDADVTTGSYEVSLIFTGVEIDLPSNKANRHSDLENNFFNQVVELQLSSGGANDKTITTPGYDVWIDQMYFYQYYGNDFVRKTSSNKDEVTVRLARLGNVDVYMSNVAMDLHYLNDLVQNAGFKGFLLPANTKLTLEMSHTEDNITSGTIYNYMVLSGHRVYDKEIQEKLSRISFEG